MVIPPVKRILILKAEGQRGMGLTVQKIRTHVRGVGWYMKDEVEKIKKSKHYKDIRKSLLLQLDINGTEGEHFKDLVEDYMAMYCTKRLLQTDIENRGTLVEYDNGGGQKGRKKNDSIDMFNKTNAQMLKLLAELGIKANASIGGESAYDEL